jgi:hypothetical protein
MKRTHAIALLLFLPASCGSRGTDAYSLDVGSDDGGPSLVVVSGADASASTGLDAHIEENHVTVTFVTLGCSGSCADVVAVATGGHAPYTYRWDDGSTSASRHVCPSSTTSYHVKVTDTGTTGELARPAQSVQVSLAADVIACPDAGYGTGDAAASVPSADACAGGIRNPSLEGTPQTAIIGLWDAQGWTQCPFFGGYPTFIANASAPTGLGVPLPPPTNGNTYAAIQATTPEAGIFTPPGFGQDLCTPISARTSFRVDSMWIDLDQNNSSAAAPDASLQLQIFGGQSVCSDTDLLWTSPPLTHVWTTYCATLAPSQPTPTLYFNGQIKGANGTLILVDNIVPVASCP